MRMRDEEDGGGRRRELTLSRSRAKAPVGSKT
jgi:hypothetical protein